MAYIHLIGEALQRDIKSYRNQSFETFGLNVFVYPVSNSNPIINLDGFQVGYHKYNFDVWGEPGKIMRIRIYPKGVVKILYMGRYRPVGAFLKNLKPKMDWNNLGNPGDFSREQIVHGRWAQQSRWWLANGKKFRLLDLPPEIREIIYDYVWGPFIEPYPTSKARKIPESTKQAMLERKPNSNLLRTSRLIYEEASNILFLFTPFVVQHYGIMGPLTSRVEQRARIRQLELALSHDDFMRLFRKETVRKSGLVIPGGSPEALALRQMKLNRLLLTIQAPSFTTASGRFDGACQKTAVDLILDAAWPFVRGHPVQLAGYVKRTQKNAFEAKCLVERKKFELWQKQRLAIRLSEGDLRGYYDELDEEDGGVILDEKTRALDEALKDEIVEVEKAEEEETSLTCKCRVPCTPKHWTPED